MKPNSALVKKMAKSDPEIAAFISSLLTRNDELEKLVKDQHTIIQRQAKQIEKLEDRVKELERQLGQNSNNSSKPPSSDGLRKPTNLRKSGAPKGPPKGHPGHTLSMVHNPDHIIVHSLTSCSVCQSSLAHVPVLNVERRQVFDLPEPRMVVTEHQSEQKYCACCGITQQASFPESVQAPTQYGVGFAAWTAYLHGYQLVPLHRITRMFIDFTGVSPCEGSLLSYLDKFHEKLEPVEQEIRAALLQEPVVHADETMLRVGAKGHWLHTACTSKWTLLGVHKKRGHEGISALKVLSTHKGIVVHDCCQSYFKDVFSFEHALCNAHLLRECKGISEYDHHQWSSDMMDLLQGAWERVKEARANGKPLAIEAIQDIKARYDRILEQGALEWAKDVVREKEGTRGRKIKSKAANLGERFKLHKEAVLRFIWDARVPFDNNEAERSLRMPKIKVKISGSFRTEDGAHTFARIHGFISTLRKQSKPLMDSLRLAYRGGFTLGT